MKRRNARVLPSPATGYPSNHDVASIFKCERIERRPLSSIKPNPRHARKHSSRQLGLLTENVREYGELHPLLVDEDNTLIDGHARLSVYQELGFDDAAVIEVAHLSAHQKRVLAISCNRLAELGEWNLDRLSVEFQDLLKLDIDLGAIGFETPEIDQIIIDGEAAAVSENEETVPLPDEEVPAVTQDGDLWVLGEHRLLCGTALDQSSYDMLLRGECAQMVATDPPYNVAIDGHVSGLGQTKHREFAMASGEMSGKQFREFLLTFLTLAGRNSDKAAIIYAFMDWRHIEDLLAAGSQAALEHKNLCVWMKTNAGMGTFYRSHHELVAVFKNGPGNHINNFGLGKKRYRTNVWQAPGVNTFRPGRMKDLEAHPTCKPTSLYTDMMLDCSQRKGLVLDPFVGSGTLFLAAERAGRVARGIELDPRYCDVAIRRWQDATGQKAVHAVSGEAFDEKALRVGAEGRVSADPLQDEAEEG
jgi:DNA modification methylase